ncbi:MAG: HopJ type III effector protein [Proteobacteria bacterium]|nr:HopJ type III effector protein [Pseudomonadota bacterium]
MNKLDEFLKQITNTPETIEFDDVISIIGQNYHYTPSHFVNGADDEKITNAAGENEGSCKIFSFAQLHKLNKEQTLNCFGRYYREDVLKNPESSDHANIRMFKKYGWQNINFDNAVLKRKK